MRNIASCISALGILTLSQAAFAGDDLTELSLDELLAREISSVAKKPQQADEAAAAVYVVSKDDIRRSGADTIPDLLRLVPGMAVTQATAWGSVMSVSASSRNTAWSREYGT